MSQTKSIQNFKKTNFYFHHPRLYDEGALPYNNSANQTRNDELAEKNYNNLAMTNNLANIEHRDQKIGKYKVNEEFKTCIVKYQIYSLSSCLPLMKEI